MGEPMSKPILHLVGLACEELAIRRYLGLNLVEPVHCSWRHFAIGGDDHIGVGPSRYLDSITENHISLGHRPSDGKHGRSQIAVVYCEKFIAVRHFSKPYVTNFTEVDYETHPWVDTIKMRLLSPASKTLDAVGDCNTAIGKGKSLGRTLRWLPPWVFPEKFKLLIRARFFQRMGKYLPKPDKGLWWQLLLPTELGGLDLWLDGDLPHFAERLPIVTLSAVASLLDGTEQAATFRALRGFTRGSYTRGYSIPAPIDPRAFLEKAMWDTVDRVPYRDALKQAGVDTNSIDIISDLKEAGYIFEDDAVDYVLRGYLFQAVLMGTAELHGFDTIPWKYRFQKIWDDIYIGPPGYIISPSQFKTAFRLAKGVGKFYAMNRKELEPEFEPEMVSPGPDPYPILEWMPDRDDPDFNEAYIDTYGKSWEELHTFSVAATQLYYNQATETLKRLTFIEGATMGLPTLRISKEVAGRLV